MKCRLTGLSLALLGVSAVLAVGGCSSGGSATTHTTTPAGHVLTITATNGAIPGTPSYVQVDQELVGDIPVTVANQNGTTVASGDYNSSALRLNVPDATFYKITLGSVGSLTFSRGELVQDGWKAAISVGGP